MKRILTIFTLLLLITACDDGDITVDAIDFSDVTAQKCSDKDLYYKIKDNEMLFLEIPDITFTENETLENTPIELPINSTNKVTYRKYASTVTSSNICGAAPDVTPNLVEQWNAIGGTIQITATAIKTTNTTTGFVSITGYRYYIVFKDITFQKPSGTQTYGEFVFGNYNVNSTAMAFGFGTIARKSTCTGDNRIFNFIGGQALIFDTTNYSTLFADAATVPGSPRRDLISSANKLTYLVFDGTINNAYFCVAPPPSSPVLKQTWNAVNGVDTVSGTIEVVTVESGTGVGFTHTIHLKNVTMKKDNTTFNMGTDFIFGSFESVP